jgi:muramidase (phage lysozyme)/uncharacterized protein YdcH (DUF465 family)
MSDTNLNPDEMQKLNEAIESLNKTLGPYQAKIESTDKVTKKINDNFAKLNKELEKLTRTVATNNHQSSKTQSTSSSKGNSGQVNTNLNTLSSTVNTLNTSFSKLSNSAVSLDRAFRSMAGSLGRNNTQHRFNSTQSPTPFGFGRNDSKASRSEKLNDALKAEFANLRRSLGSSLITRSKPSGDMSSMNAGLKQFGSVVNSVASNFGILGKVLGGFTSLIIGAVVAVNEYNDALVKSHRTFSSFGGALGTSSAELAQFAKNAGYTSANLEEYAQMLSGSAASIAALGGGAAKGVEEFSKIASVTEGLRKSMFALGVTAEELTQYQLDYTTAMMKGGTAYVKDTKDRTRVSVDWLVNQLAINELTGTTRKEAEAARDQMTNTADFNFKTSQMDMGTDEEKADSKRIKDAVQILLNAGDTKGANAVMEAFAKNGAVTSENGVNVLYGGTGGMSVKDILTSERDGGPNSLKLAQNLTSSRMNTTKQLFGSGRSGFYDSQQMGIAGVDHTTIQAYNRLKAIDPNQVGTNMAKILDTLNNGTTDNVVGAAAEKRELELKVANIQDSMLSVLSGPIAGGIKFIAKTMNKFFGDGSDTSFMNPAERELKSIEDKITSMENRNKSSLVPGSTQTEINELKAQRDSLKDQIKSGYTGDAPRATLPVKEKASGAHANLLDTIASAESGGDYNAMNGGKSVDLTNMTVSEVLAYQKSIKGGSTSTAAGKYQVMYATLKELVDQGKIDPSKKFNQGTQDDVGRQLLVRRGLNDYLAGNITSEQFADKIAQEWAGLPKANGKSAYEGVGNNKATIARSSVMSSVEATKAAQTATVQSTTAQAPATLPLSTSNAAASTPAKADTALAKQDAAAKPKGMNAATMNTDTFELVARLEKIITQLETSNDLQDKLLKHSKA